MKTIHIIYTALILTLLCSCGGISESKALKIAENTLGFNESLYRLFTIGDHWCLSDPTYENRGTGHYARPSGIDVHKPDFESDYILSKWIDTKNNQVILDLSEVGMQFSNTPYRCDGCMECYQKFAEKGLITLETINKDEGQTNRRVSVVLTDKGKAYLLDMQNKEKERELLGNSSLGIKMAYKVYTSAKEMNREKEKARYLFEYYVEYTPWSEALGYATDKNRIQRERVSFEKQDGAWKVIEKENITRNGHNRKF